MLAVAGVAGLLLVGLISLVMVLGALGGGDEEREAASAEATPEATPTPTATPSPTPVPLTRAQRAQRRAAADLVRSRGFEVTRLADYNPRRTLRVLIGRTSVGTRMAFFFVGDDYIGNDAQEPSAELKVVRSRDVRVTLAYGIYAPGDEADEPTGGPVRVRFAWDGAQLTPLDPIPPPEQRTPGRQAG